MIFEKLERLVPLAVAQMIPAGVAATDEKLTEVLFGIHDAFWVAGQTCAFLSSGAKFSDEQTRLLATFGDMFPPPALNNPEQIKRDAQNRTSANWNKLRTMADNTIDVLLMIRDQRIALDLRDALVEFAQQIGRGGAASQSADVFISSLNAKATTALGASEQTNLIGISDSTALDELNGLIGLDCIKSEIRGFCNLIAINQRRAVAGFPLFNLSNHMVFYGNPGTGKTTVARIVGKILRDLGVLSSGHMIEISRSGLVAGYVGQTALKVESVISQALNGILFIDEAYTLKQSDDDSFGQEAIDALLKLMEDHRSCLVVIVAGYTTQMQNFLRCNPGLESRFNRFLNFPDYDESELFEIFSQLLTEKKMELTEAAVCHVKGIFARAVESQSGGNGRFVRNLFERTIINQATRLSATSVEDVRSLLFIEKADLPTAMSSMVGVSE
jgi:Cdc6-like AAA superfamily ATPase